MALCDAIPFLAFFIFSLMSVQAQSSPARALIFSATADFRHDSIPTARDALIVRGTQLNVHFDATEDAGTFTDAGLAPYDLLIFLMNTGEVLDDEGKAALQRYLDLGGNFMAIHAASDCLRSTTFYGREVGAFFDYHPELQNAIVDVIDATHPSTSMLPAQWSVRDEMYNFKSDPRSAGAVIILSANDSSYTDPGPRNFDQGTPHPTSWYQEHGAGVERGKTAGRSFYTSLGHLNETWQDDLFLGHVSGGISWSLQSNTTRAFNPSAQVGNPSGSSNSPSSTSAAQASSGSPPNTTLSPSSASRVVISSVTLATIGAFALLALS